MRLEKVQINTLGSVLKYYRKKYKIRQEELCEGICATADLSQIETGKKVVDSLVAEALLGRIGKSVLQFELLLNDEDYLCWQKREVILKAENKMDYETVLVHLLEYEKIMPQNKPLHMQFYLFHKAKCMIEMDPTDEEICDILYKALCITKSQDFFDGVMVKQLYNPLEIELVLLLFRYGYPKWENRDREGELLQLFGYVQNVYSGRQKEITGVMILFELVKMEMHLGDYRRVIKQIDKAIDFISQGRSIEHIAELHFLKAQAMEKLYRNSDVWVLKEEICREECKMSYYVFQVLGQVSELNEVQKFCEEKLQWQIIE